MVINLYRILNLRSTNISEVMLGDETFLFIPVNFLSILVNSQRCCNSEVKNCYANISN